MNKLKLPLILFLTSCTTVGHEFCIGNGYEKGSSQYESCTARYKQSRDLYEYCTGKGIGQEGAGLNQCIATASQLKDNYSQDRSACDRDSNAKFSGFFSQPKREKQPTLRSNGTVTLDEIKLTVGYNGDERNSYTNPFIQECMRIYGWNDSWAWQGGKNPAGINAITSQLSALNKKPILVSVPENPISGLFKAVSDGNAPLVKDIITRGMNVNSQNYQGYAALHVAAKQGNFLIVRMLIEELNADTGLRSSQGENAIDMAARSSNPSLVGYITDVLRKRDEERIRAEAERRRKEDEARHQKELDEIKKAIEAKK